jgi:putative protein-disulfide isomerase
MKTKIVVAFDPLCGWCFGFLPSLRALRNALGDRAEFTLASSGLVVGDREKPIGQMADGLLRGMAQVEKRSGARFGAAFKNDVLAKGTWVSRSEPGCRAIFAAQVLFGEKAFDFADALATAFYQDGMLPDDPATLRDCAEEAGIDGAQLIEACDSGDAKTATHALFALWKQRGITSYPGVFIEQANGKLECIFDGYVEPDVAIERVEAVLG